jgi:hypothetical protein
MNVKRILVGYMIKFLIPALNSLQDFNEGTMSGWAYAYLYSGSFYTSRTLPASSSTFVDSGRTKQHPLRTSRKKKSGGVNRGEQGGQVIRPPVPVHFHGNFDPRSLKLHFENVDAPRLVVMACHYGPLLPKSA